MGSVDALEAEISDILEKVANNLQLKNYELEFETESEKGNGFLGEFFMGNVTDKEKNEKKYIAIKKAAGESSALRKALDMPLLYKNENYFYSTVFPALDKFQKDRNVTVPLDPLPIYFFGNDQLYQESVVMENLFYSGYQLHDKTQPITKQQAELVFETYGKFHALSFAYKDQHNKEYQAIVSKLVDFYLELRNCEPWCVMTNRDSKKILDYLTSKQMNEVAKKFEPVGKDLWKVFRETCVYEGEYKGVLHGDCWSNNMMFKYDESKILQDIKILDFQITREGTPVFDLSYFLYASGSKKNFDQLDHYLDIYHKSFSDFAKELGSDPQTLYPMEELKRDWKKYSWFGIKMAFNILHARQQKKEEIGRTATQSEEIGTEMNNDYSTFFLEAASDIVVHACEYGIL